MGNTCECCYLCRKDTDLYIHDDKVEPDSTPYTSAYTANQISKYYYIREEGAVSPIRR